MEMTLIQGIITVAVVVLGTMTTRFLPFLVFPEGKKRRTISVTSAQCFRSR